MLGASFHTVLAPSLSSTDHMGESALQTANPRCNCSDPRNRANQRADEVIYQNGTIPGKYQINVGLSHVVTGSQTLHPDRQISTVNSPLDTTRKDGLKINKDSLNISHRDFYCGIRQLIKNPNHSSHCKDMPHQKIPHATCQGLALH